MIDQKREIIACDFYYQNALSRSNSLNDLLPNISQILNHAVERIWQIILINHVMIGETL